MVHDAGFMLSLYLHFTLYRSSPERHVVVVVVGGVGVAAAAAVVAVTAVVLALIRMHSQVCGDRTGSRHSGVEEYPREKTQANPKWFTYLSCRMYVHPPINVPSKSEIGSQRAYVACPYWYLYIVRANTGT